MKIIFEDQSYVELTIKEDKYYLSMVSRNSNQQKIINSVSLTKEQFKQLISETL